MFKKKKNIEGFPGGLEVKVPRFHCRGKGLIPGQGTKILQAMCGMAKKRKKKNIKSRIGKENKGLLTGQKL